MRDKHFVGQSGQLKHLFWGPIAETHYPNSYKTGASTVKLTKHKAGTKKIPASWQFQADDGEAYWMTEPEMAKFFVPALMEGYVCLLV